MTKPQPRRSALAGQSVINQTVAEPQENRPTPTPQKDRNQKITVRVDATVADEARGLFIDYLANDGPTTWSKWVEQALIAYNKQVRTRLQTPVQPRGAGTLPVGPRGPIN